jgi:hypothetical protein
VIYCVAGCIHAFGGLCQRWNALMDRSGLGLTALRSVVRLDVVHGYACGGLGRVPCQDGLKPAKGGLQRLVTKTYE